MMSTLKPPKEPIASSSKATSSKDDYPDHIKQQMKEFGEVLAEMKEAIVPLTFEHQDLQSRIDNPLDSARVDLTTVYTLNSLFWVYLTTKGESPRDHDIMRELSRLKAYMTRLKELQTKESRQTVDIPATARVIKNALFDPKSQATVRTITNTNINTKKDNGEDTGPPKKKRRNR
jgi:exosome complex protein LRP1